MSKYKYQSQITGEIVTNFKEVIKTFFEEYGMKITALCLAIKV